MNRFYSILAALSFSPAALLCASAPHSPLAPADALRAFQLEPGLRVEWVAAEPLTVAPCAVAWDELGRMYVAENRGYPTGGPDGSAVGVIALLEDTDGDGRCDRRTEFATGLTFPNGLMPWRGGLIVTCAPEVLFLKDTDGDGHADVKEVLLTGFTTNTTTQLRVNRPVLSQDGWVYLASGLSGGRITSPKQPDAAPLEMRGDLRFKPDTGQYEAVDGKSQFGQSFDDFCRRFGVFNRVQVQHFVLPSRYVSRNPHLPSPGVLQNCPELLENLWMRGGGGAARIYPISANVTTADSHAGTFTAACAVHVYRSQALPEPYRGNAFSCDPTGNLVHRDRLVPSGATFRAERVGREIEFLRSSDDWFRPVYLESGPEGALYVCDMYRRVIEHPEYLPTELRKHTDFESGKDRGRIWRVLSTGDKPHAARAKEAIPGRASNSQLVSELDHPLAWRRETAFRLLLERADPTTARGLRSGLRKAPPAGASLRLHLLALLGALSDEDLMRGLQSSSPGVREVALQLAEPRLASAPRLAEAAAKLGSDEDARVRFQLALAIGSAMGQGTEAGRWTQLLASIGMQQAGDKWSRAAVLSSSTGREQDVWKATAGLKPAERFSADASLFLEDLGRVWARATPAGGRLACVEEILARTSDGLDHTMAALAGFAEESRASVRTTPGSPAGLRLQSVLAECRKSVGTGTAPVPERVRAVRLLGLHPPEANELLLERLRAGEPAELQLAMVRALTEPDNASGVRELLRSDRWPSYTPMLRGVLLSAVASRPEHHGALLNAIESGALPASSLDAERREQLRRAKDSDVQARAQRLLAAAAGGDRKKALDEAGACLALTPVPANGREVFKRVCAGCHRLDREGVAVGPDLFGIRNQPKETLLLHIVIPEQEIAPNYANYLCETRDGRTLSGLIVAETPASVTFRQAFGVEETVSRSAMLSLTASRLSLMPQELERGMTRQELADLLAYLKGEE